MSPQIALSLSLSLSLDPSLSYCMHTLFSFSFSLDLFFPFSHTFLFLSLQECCHASASSPVHLLLVCCLQPSSIAGSIQVRFLSCVSCLSVSLPQSLCLSASQFDPSLLPWPSDLHPPGCASCSQARTPSSLDDWDTATPCDYQILYLVLHGCGTEVRKPSRLARTDAGWQ